MAVRKYYLGKGRVQLFQRLANGALGKGLFIGNSPELKLSLSVEKKEHTESYSGTNAVDASVIIKSGAELSLSIDELTAETMELLVKGVKRTIAAGNFANYALPLGMANNDFAKLPNGNLSNVVVRDSAGTPATVPAAKYAVDLTFGRITMLDVAGYTQPFKVDANFAQVTSVALLDDTERERFLVFEGINLNDNSNVLLEIPRLRFEPSGDVDFIGDDFAKYPLKASVLPDETRAADPNLGQFGRLIFL